MSIIAELKRRNVLRVAALYLVAAWVLLQVGDLLFGLLDLPAWSNKLLFAGLVLGFVPALIFSWVYELTPEGLKREHEVERNASTTAETARKLDLIVVGLLVIAIVVVAVQRFMPRTAPVPAATVATSGSSSVEMPAPAAAKSIAVLPFADMSAGKDQEYFADGLSEELLNLLAKLPELRVIGRTSSFQFKGRNEDLRVIGEKLNVVHVLEGSVRKSGNKVRITAQLIKAADGSHLWSETYDRTLDDIFAVQDDIAGEVVKALKLTLLGTTSVTRSRPVNPEAYNLALQGRFFVERRGQKDLERAVEYFRRSRERDPGYAPAWAGLSQAYARQADYGFAPPADGYRQAREAAEKALALDPQLVDAHLAMGSIHLVYDWDWAAADASFRRALDLEPGNAQALKLASIPASTLGTGAKRLIWRQRLSSAIRCVRLPTTTSASLCWQSTATQPPKPPFVRRWNWIQAGPRGRTGSGGRCCCRARPTPPSRRWSRRRRRSGGSLDCRSYFTRSAGAASPTRRSQR